MYGALVSVYVLRHLRGCHIIIIIIIIIITIMLVGGHGSTMNWLNFGIDLDLIWPMVNFDTFSTLKARAFLDIKQDYSNFGSESRSWIQDKFF